ncbi:MAG: GTPase, partial [Bacteriovoracaceae bacterium]
AVAGGIRQPHARQVSIMTETPNINDALSPELKSSGEDEDDREIELDEIPDEEDYFQTQDLEKALDEFSEQDLAQEEDVQEQSPEEDSPYRSIKVIDTAGIRKQKQVKGFIEEQSVYRSLKAITESDIVIFMVDATKGITHQDRRLCDIALEKGKSIIICLNKVDLLKDIMSDGRKKREWLLDLRASIPWLGFCELIPLSAKKGSYISHLKRSLVSTMVIRSQKVSTSRLNKTVTHLVDRHPITLDKSAGKRFRVKYASMLKASPPTFLLFTNKSQGIPANYRRYLSNGLRREFQLVNTPVHLIFRTSGDIEKRLQKTAPKTTKI